LPNRDVHRGSHPCRGQIRLRQSCSPPDKGFQVPADLGAPARHPERTGLQSQPDDARGNPRCRARVKAKLFLSVPSDGGPFWSTCPAHELAADVKDCLAPTLATVAIRCTPSRCEQSHSGYGTLQAHWAGTLGGPQGGNHQPTGRGSQCLIRLHREYSLASSRHRPQSMAKSRQ
jgi:hypothetical protein